ncbi:MAG: winged helix-turn-helix domain-containing protein [Candidatus Omnitrophica bacterium]|nr:winged helix-turn-helix domain-containing protein [Candidatus Omnitrophota bacterium]
MITEIGIVAGEVWQYLEKYSEATLSKIAKAIKRERDTVLLSLGWLGREGHIFIKKEGDEYKITFQKKQ